MRGRRAILCLRVFFIFALFVLTVKSSSRSVYAIPRIQDTGEELVVVIDPGHGGENEGTDTSEVLEKYRTLITAQAMYDELSKYDGVKVYLTRTEDIDMTLRARAEYAAAVGADFLFSLHYNASEEHAVFGAELWIPASLPEFNYGYQFGEIWLSEMGARGIHLRGVKTRLNDSGGEYYGIIREGKALGVPTVILEHCHLDAEQDASFCDTEEKERELGRADATAVAKYFGLRSSELGVDYSGMELALVSPQDVAAIPLGQSTAPEVCEIELTGQDEESGEVSLRVTARDSNELLEYYDYSLDGGASWQGIAVWQGYDHQAVENREEMTLRLTLPRDRDAQLCVRVYNFYDQTTQSNVIPVHFRYQDELAEAARAWDETHNGEPAVGGTGAAAAYESEAESGGEAADGGGSGAYGSGDAGSGNGSGGTYGENGGGSSGAANSSGNGSSGTGSDSAAPALSSDTVSILFGIAAALLLAALVAVAIVLLRRREPRKSRTEQSRREPQKSRELQKSRKSQHRRRSRKSREP